MIGLRIVLAVLRRFGGVGEACGEPGGQQAVVHDALQLVGQTVPVVVVDLEVLQLAAGLLEDFVVALDEGIKA